jgi:hypothetical protein
MHYAGNGYFRFMKEKRKKDCLFSQQQHVYACTIVALGFFYRKPSATGSYCWLPAPLGWKLAYAGNTKTVENNRNWAELLLHDVYFIRSKDPQIHNNHVSKTTINWFSRTCNESKITLYYWLYTVGAQSIAHLAENYANSLNSISGHRCPRELWFFLFERSSIGEEFQVLIKQYIIYMLLS